MPAPPYPISVCGVPLVAAATYAPPVADAVRRFKYAARPDLALPLSRMLWPGVAGLALAPTDVFVPVPLHPARLIERGYNQSALVARQLGRRARAEVAPVALMRVRRTMQLAGQRAEIRHRAVQGAFALRRPHGWHGRRVLIVDDVVTTGATMAACVTALQAAGATVLAVVAIASAPVPGRGCPR